jgi:hypothetical protein
MIQANQKNMHRVMHMPFGAPGKMHAAFLVFCKFPSPTYDKTHLTRGAVIGGIYVDACCDGILH